ncbi:putative transcriptional regulator, PucR family [Caldalkalibacillus thermarum TA2.A1]|uniref:Helix-turn-helix domain-containing protein n=2 Tax=Caldalkalibacillus TaxID=379065 RepID=F5LAG1_CALTT|nr:helix-turn-helix domain-containing protein [Caldalkalibacillus thermarum]EGL81710.1 putative transcriptional regulator, PucR family [Caldalkalibacillus thermarum TA2.A1]QZT33297.1 helix-turn-helix domain-containing protein [Caldalkalibacillus thermarum TA2.A1]
MEKRKYAGLVLMEHLKQTWLYLTLVKIFGKQTVVVDEGKQRPNFAYFPVKDGEHILGWLGLPHSVLDEKSKQLIEVLVTKQPPLSNSGVGGEALYWRTFMKQDLRHWERQWDKLNYPADTRFGNIYFWIKTEQNTEELYPAVKEIVEGVLEEKSILVPYTGNLFVWVIPDYDQQRSLLADVVEGILDTIRSECMLDCLCYLGEAYPMPTPLQDHVHQELSYFRLAHDYQIKERVLYYRLLIPYLLLESLSKEERERMVDKLVGLVREDQELMHTIRVFLEQNLNVSETAKKLYIHRNSMQYRLDKFIEKTGIDIRQFKHAMTVYLALLAISRLD